MSYGVRERLSKRKPGPTRPATLAEAVHRANSGEQRYEYALPEFLDAFYLATERQAMIDEEPEPMESPVRHAMLGAIAEHLALR
jgi:hypothetical protein